MIIMFFGNVYRQAKVACMSTKTSNTESVLLLLSCSFILIVRS